MGIDMFAVGEDGVLLDKAFSDIGLDSNFRHCQVANWEDVVRDCLALEDFSDICWRQHPPNVVKAWLELAKSRMFHGHVDAERFIQLLEICARLNASVYVF